MKILKDSLFGRSSWQRLKQFAFWVERLAFLIDAWQRTGSRRQSGVVGSTTTVTEMSQRWQSDCARSSRLDELHSNAVSMSRKEEKDDEEVA
jgi:hypothetical protein